MQEMALRVVPDQETVGGGVYQSGTSNENLSFFKSSGTAQAFEINTPICVNFKINLMFTLKNESGNDFSSTDMNN